MAPALTTTTVTSSPDPSVVGETVTFTATVAPVLPGAGTPTGTVNFLVTDGVTTVSLTGTLSGGTVSVSTNGLVTAGLYTVTATYSGDANFTGSVGADTQTVGVASTTTAVTTSPDPSVVGETVTFTATVSPVSPGAGTPTGTVAFVATDGVTTVSLTGTLSGGTTSVSTNGLVTAGTYTVTATYAGDGNFTGSVGSDTQTVNQAATTTAVTTSPDPSVVGETVTFSATVSPVSPGAGTPTGTVTFVATDGVTTVSLTGTLSGGTTSVSTNGLVTAGTYSVTATYSGDGNFTGSVGSDTQTVNQAATTTAVTTSPDPSVFGESVTLSATVAPVSPGAGTPTGTVTFVVTGGPTLTATLSGGTASVNTTAIPVGTSTVTATYSGDGNFTGSVGSDTQTVTQASTTTAVTTSPDPSVFGESVTLTATVAPVLPGAGTPTGTVTFVVTGGPTLTAPLVGGTASVTTSAIPVGVSTVTATYSGDGNFTGSSGTDTQTVAPAATTTAVSSSPDPSVVGEPVTFTATVSPVPPGAGTPTGTVTFVVTDGVTTVGLTGTLSGGTVSVSTNGLVTAGVYTVTATYTGDGNFTGSVGADTQTVNQASTTTLVTSAPDPSVFGEPVTLTATVAAVPPGAGTPTGTVTFVVTGGPTLTATLSGGTASVTTSAIPVGTSTVTATYSGDLNFTASSGTDTQTVSQASTTTLVTSAPDPSVVGEPVTFTATVSPVPPGAGTPTGTVTFVATDGVTTVSLTGTLIGGTASVTTNGLVTAGTYTVTATYSGDGNFTGSVGTDTQTVGLASTTTLVTSAPNPSVFGEPVTFTATVSPVLPGAGTPTGTVTFVVTGGPTLTAPLVGGTASVTTSAIPVGVSTVTATYSGDGNFTGSSGTDTQTVAPAATTTAVSSSPDPSVVGEPVTFTATVSPVPPGAGTPTGTVTFVVTDGVTTVGLTGTLSGGTVSVSTNGLVTAGVYTVTATYTGDGNFTGSVGADTQTVNQASTTTLVTSAPDPSVFGEPVTLTATVAAVPPGAGTPTGTVTFVVTGGPTLTATLSGGTASVTTSAIPVGTSTVTATYSGDLNFTASSGTDTQTVSQASTTTLVTSAPDPSVVGEPVTFTATVSPVPPGAGTPTGTVTFVATDGVTTVSLTGTLIGGTASVTTNGLVTAGTYTVTATYSGDGNFTGSVGTDTQTVGLASTTTLVTSAPNPSVFGEPVTFTATVSPVLPGAGTPTGTVTFVGTGGPAVTVPLVGGTASVTTSTMLVGTTLVTATYSGDSNFTASSGTDPHTVAPAATTTAVSSLPDPSVVGETVTLTATVSPVSPGAGIPTGTVTFVATDGLTTVTLTGTLSGGTTSVTSNGLVTAGVYTVTAAYGGDGNFTGSSGADTQTVNQASTTTAVTSTPDPSAVGESVSFTATVAPVAPGAGTPTGTVTFVIDGGGGGTLTGTLSGGTTTVSTSTLDPGTHNVTATYSGDADFSTSSGTDTQTVNQATTTTSVVSAPDPSVFGEPVVFTATVAVDPPGVGIPTGTVAFVIDGAGGGTLTGTVVAGIATVTTTTLEPGTHNVTATYSGDVNFAGSSGTDTQTVNQASTLTTVTSAPDPSLSGNAVNFTAVVVAVPPGVGIPSGTVNFTITDGVTTVNLPGTLDVLGVATVSTALTTGVYTVTATYVGDTDFTGSTGLDTQTVL
ncbi:beta strand repeat-containing protein [Streptomyces sioyaensis]|uniref:beta strand repeat-containing protein n=1 Tax=Streptomyces sioyaensis TaxID=67364 RepID=UPI003792DC81